MRTLVVLCSVLCSVLHVSAAQAGEPDVPPERAATILARALAYDRGLEARAGEAVSVGIVRRGGDPRCDAIAVGFRALEKSKMLGRPFRVLELPYADGSSLDGAAAAGVDALYICPGLDAELPAITAASRKMRIVTLSVGAAYVAKGVSIGLVMDETKPKLLINAGASKSEGAQFASELLQLAKVIK